MNVYQNQTHQKEDDNECVPAHTASVAVAGNVNHHPDIMMNSSSNLSPKTRVKTRRVWNVTNDDDVDAAEDDQQHGQYHHHHSKKRMASVDVCDTRDDSMKKAKYNKTREEEEKDKDDLVVLSMNTTVSTETKTVMVKEDDQEKEQNVNRKNNNEMNTNCRRHDNDDEHDSTAVASSIAADAVFASDDAAGNRENSMEQTQEQESLVSQSQAQLAQQQQQDVDTIILIDYDDTILASSWLVESGLDLNTPDEIVANSAEELHVIEAAASRLLSKAIELGEVHLVTNAEEGWVELTAEKFIPAILPLLQHITIVSARTSFEMIHPACPRTWKVLAFRQQISNSLIASHKQQLQDDSNDRINTNNIGDSISINSVAELSAMGEETEAQKNWSVKMVSSASVSSITATTEEDVDAVVRAKRVNLLSLGDSHHEREALKVVATEYPNSWSKTVKFVERPNIATLEKQLELMHECLEYICNFEGNLDLMLSQILENDEEEDDGSDGASARSGGDMDDFECEDDGNARSTGFNDADEERNEDDDFP